METQPNKPMHLYDWMTIAIVVFFILTCYFGCQTYKLSNSSPQNELPAVPQELIAQNAQKRYDSLSFATEKQLDSLKLMVATKKTIGQMIIIKYKTIHDTIESTPEINQQHITKMLCPATGDSINIKEINYCLAEGKQAQDLFRNSVSEIHALELEVKLNEELVVEGVKNMEAKETLNATYREVNGALNEILQKQAHRKKIWRNVSVGSIVTLIAVVLISF